MSARAMERAALVLAVAAVAGPVGAEESSRPGGADARQRMESLEGHLDRAVARVSVPHAGILIGRSETTRGIRLPGYGILFVLTPRALPGHDALYVLRRAPGPGRGVAVPVPAPAAGGANWSTPIHENEWQPEHVEEIERQVLVLQHVAEAERRAAEEDMERIVHRVRIRLAPPSTDAPPPAATGAVATPAEAAAEPGGVDFPPDDLELPAAPPWKFWFEGGPAAEERSPDEVVRDVRTAVVGALESQARRVADLRADEFVIVAVDFVPGGLFASHPRPERTLVVRVRQKDLESCARGGMKPGELAKRAEVFEY